MRILVTGGAGFIGSALVRQLIGLGHAVLNVDSLTYAGNPASLADLATSPFYRFVKADISDRAAMDAAFTEFRPLLVMHLAAESHVDRSINASGAFIHTNILGTFTLLEVARNYWAALPEPARAQFRFLHVSTDEVFGSLAADGLFTEASPYNPSSPYSASKAAADHLVRAWGRTYGLPVMVSNCSNNYGPRHFPEKLVPLTIINALEGKPLTVYGDGSNIRDWLFVEDHARALWLIATRGQPGETWNVGARSEHTNLDVVERICALMDILAPKNHPHSALITFVADRPGHDQRYAIDASKLERKLGWKPVESFDSGLRKTVEWYLGNESWWRPLRKHVYSGERLGIPG